MRDQDKNKVLPHVHLHIASEDISLSPSVLAKLWALHVDVQGGGVSVITNPLPPTSKGRSADTWSQSEREFAQNLVGCEKNLTKLAIVLCRSYGVPDPEDMVQTTLMHAWAGREAYRSGNIGAWTARILRARVIDEMRKSIRKRQGDNLLKSHGGFDLEAAAENPIDVFDLMRNKVFPYISRPLRDILVLRVLGYTCAETGEILGQAVQYVSKYERLACKAAAQLLDPEKPDEKAAKPSRKRLRTVVFKRGGPGRT